MLFLYHYRLNRIHQRNEFNAITNEKSVRNEDSDVCLFDDYVVLDKENHSYFVGKVGKKVLANDQCQ